MAVLGGPQPTQGEAEDGHEDAGREVGVEPDTRGHETHGRLDGEGAEEAAPDGGRGDVAGEEEEAPDPDGVGAAAVDRPQEGEGEDDAPGDEEGDVED